MGRNRVLEGWDDEGLGAGDLSNRTGFNADAIPDATADVFREQKKAVSKVESRLGIDIPNDSLGFADFDAIGVHITEGDKRTGILLNRSYYNRSSSAIIADMNRMQGNDWLGGATGNNSKLQYTMVHELGHSIWVRRIEGKDPKLKDLTAKMKDLYREHNKVVRRTGNSPISRYAKTNVNEFVAEGVAKGLLRRDPDSFSKRIVALLKEYRTELSN